MTDIDRGRAARVAGCDQRFDTRVGGQTGRERIATQVAARGRAGDAGQTYIGGPGVSHRLCRAHIAAAIVYALSLHDALPISAGRVVMTDIDRGRAARVA